MKPNKITGKIDSKKVASLAEKQVAVAAKSDKDVKLLTLAQLKKFKRVNPPQEVDVKGVRQKLNLSQKKFAGYFGVSVRTVQEWEQHRRTPTATARNFLRVIELAPQIVQKALAGNL